MSAALLIWIWGAPLLALPFVAWKASRWLLVAAPVPALLIALSAPMVPDQSVLRIPWLLLGVVWGLDETGRLFLLAGSILYLAAALYSLDQQAEDVQTTRYRAFFLLSMSGNLGLAIAWDMASFYYGFSLMSLCAYGLLKPSRTQTARYAARWYMTMAIMGEVAILIAVVILNALAGELEFVFLHTLPMPAAVVLLLILGFGIKLGLPGLHMWMPLTYLSAPTASVAVLSGAMINAGILGLLRFLPPDNASLSSWGVVLIAMGMTGSLYGVVIGLLQTMPRTVLAYSSISKMGLLVMGLGLALDTPEAAPLMTTAVTLYACHHGLVKGALFLGTDLHSRAHSAGYFPALCFLSLALAGAPLTSGAAAKLLFKDAVPAAWHPLGQFLLLAGLATALLLGRFLYLAWHRQDKSGTFLNPRGWSRVAYAVLLAIVAVAPFWVLPVQRLLSGGIPLLVATTIIWLAWRHPPRLLQRWRFTIPPGDLLPLIERSYVHGRKSWDHLAFRVAYSVRRSAACMARLRDGIQAWPWESMEILLRHWELAGALWLLLCLGLILLLV